MKYYGFMGKKLPTLLEVKLNIREDEKSLPEGVKSAESQYKILC